MPDAKVVVPHREYENGYDGENARAKLLQVHDDTLFFAAGKQLYSVPASGGTPTSLYTAEATIGVLWVVEDEVLVGPASGDSLEVIPKTGGAATSSIKLPASYGAQDIVLAPNGSTIFFRNNALRAFYYWRYDRKSGESLELASSLEVGYPGPIVLQGNYLYVGRPQTQGLALAANAIYRLPVGGGELEAVPVKGEFAIELVGSDDDSLYFLGELPDAEPAFYRLPLAGGEPEAVIDPDWSPIVGAAFKQTVFTNLSDRAVVAFDNEILELPRAGQGRTLLTSGCVVSAFASNDTHAFVATPDNSNRMEILRVPLP